MKHAGPTRREIGVRTAFNLLGPLTNPAGATRAALGVGDAAAAPRMAEVARAARARSGRSSSTATASTSCRSTARGVLYDVTPDGDRAARRSTPPTLGLARTRDDAALAGGTPDENARIDRGASCAASPARGATSCCSTPGAALLVAGAVEHARGRHRAGGADDRRRARGRSCSSDCAPSAGRPRPRRRRPRRRGRARVTLAA